MRLGAYLRGVREECGLTAQQLAVKAQVHAQVIYDYENGKTKRLKTAVLSRICEALGIDEYDVAENYADDVNTQEEKKPAMQVVKQMKTTEPKKRKESNAGEKQSTREIADMVLDALHVFCCGMNSDGRRLSLEAMKMFAGTEMFRKEKG